MPNRPRLSTAYFRPTTRNQPPIKPVTAWPPGNASFYADFRAWLKEGGYGDSALNLYGVAARLALGLIDKSYAQIDPTVDLDRVRAYLAEYYDNESTRAEYNKGLKKLAEYLALRNRRSQTEKPINWAYYTAGLPPGWADLLRAYIAHCRRNWLPEQRYRATLDSASHLTGSLRWLAANTGITRLAEITPGRWYEYVDARLANKIKPATLNAELHHLHGFLRFLATAGEPVSTKLLGLEGLTEGDGLPRDVPPDQLRRLQLQIEAEAAVEHLGQRRLGLMDKAWFLLMLHSGLRTGEVRRLKQADLDLPGQRVRIEQSKGLKDRVVYLSQPTVKAIEAYLAVRGPAPTDHVFLFRHRPLGVVYCLNRLKTYGQRCDVIVTPHMLRHSAATMLINAGVPIVTVQALLGHRHIDTTLGYARLYDGTVAADYYRAIGQVEKQLALAETPPEQDNPAHLLALVDSLQAGTLNENQKEAVQALRKVILNLATQPAERTG